MDNLDIANDVPYGTLIVIDDERDAIEEIRKSLRKYKEIKIEGYTVYDDRFKKAVLREDVKGVSLDWIMYSVDKGPDILNYLKKVNSNIATIVTTRYAEKKREAILFGVDSFRIRSANEDDVEEYADILKLTYKRDIIEKIEKNIHKINSPLDISDNTLMNTAKEVVFAEYVKTGMINCGLKKLLIGRKWWEKSAIDNYSRLEIENKFIYLSRFAGLNESVVNATLEEHRSQENEFNSLKKILAIMGYLLKSVKYEFELLPYIIKNINLFKRNVPICPWQEIGFSEYVNMNKKAGVDIAYSWVFEDIYV